jgi:predicted DNA binding protein
VNYQLLWQVNANSPSELDEYLAYIKKNQNTKSLTVLQKGKQNALILLRFMSPTSSYDKIIESGVVNTSPVVAREGLETYKILSSDPGSIKKALKGLSDVGDIKIKKIGNFGDDDSGIPRLTSKQVEALQLALQSNYYYWPREATLEQLAASAKISRRSMQERLRRAETKLFPFAIKEFLKKKM